MEISGLPLHPLVVHAVVVFAPLSGLAALVYAAVPRWRWAVRWPLVAMTLVAVGGAVLAAMSGQSLLESREGLEALPGVQDHRDAGTLLRNVMLGFGVVTLVGVWRLGVSSPLTGRREAAAEGAVGLVLRALMVLASLAVLYAAFKAGDTGARAVWG